MYGQIVLRRGSRPPLRQRRSNVKFHKKTFLTALFVLSSIISCSGGGGEGDDGPEGSADTGARVLHTAMDLPPVSLLSTARVGEVVSDTRFAEPVGFSELPEGDQTISVQSVDGGNGPVSFSVTVKKNERREILIYGTRETYGIGTALLPVEKPQERDGFASVRVVHGASGASGLRGNVGTDELSRSVPFGQASGYLQVPAGDVLIRLTRAADSRLLVNQLVTVEAKKTYSFVVAGEVDYLIKSQLLEN